ncbi:ornithine carbamoyltransferase [Candidatus Methanophagaceae archaeon]|nr:ornithine carbamoyltransferase [Methanophagales archaeon]
MDLISVFDLSRVEIEAILKTAEELRTERKEGKRTSNALEGKSLALIFEKPSTRTRVSFEVAMLELGGNVMSLNRNELQLGRGERIRETAKVFSSYVDSVMIRAFQHSTIQEFARYASIPVINGLSDLEHPCQTLADLMTIKSYKNGLAGVKVAWIGDGNNVCNSLIGGCAITGMEIAVACPKGYEPDAKIVKRAAELGCEVNITEDAEEAATDADVLSTDVWVSMGDEDETKSRKNAFKKYQINEGLIRAAKEDVIVMHCMPVHVGEEMTEEVINSDKSVIFEQAENRLHAQKALMLTLLN